MATNNLPQLEVQSPCKPSPNEILANFQEIFSSQIEPDVVKLILTECDYNENASLESLFALVGETSGGKLNKGQRERQEATSKIKTGGEQNSDKSIYKNRISTIYKSNEGLYCEDTAFNGDDFHCTEADQFSNLPQFLDSKVDLASEKQVAIQYQQNNKSTAPILSNGTLLVDQNSYSATPSQWNGCTDLGFSEIQDSISPDSDKSIEADASEHIDLQQVDFKEAQLAQKPTFDVMAEFYMHKNPAHRHRSQTPSQSRHSPNKNPSNMPTPGKRQSNQNSKAMSQKEYIMLQIAKGKRVLVLLRGCPGSGKTTLAREIKFKGVIYSTDNFFVTNGMYQFDPGRLSEAHSHNKFLTMRAMQVNRTPIIIDNTNLVDWEMAPYVTLALQYNYEVYFLEPQTAWRYDPRQLALRNTHNIRFDKIVSMLHKFDRNVTVRTMKEQYFQNNGGAARPRPSINRPVTNKTQINGTRPSPNHHKQKQMRRPKSPKSGLENEQRSTNEIGNKSANPSWMTYSVYDSSDSDSNPRDFTSNFINKRNNLKKCKSVPNLVDPEVLFSNHSQEPRSSGFTEFGCPEPAKYEPEYISENMRDLMELDFNLMHFPTDETSAQNQIPETGDVENKKVHGGRLAAMFKNLPTDWDVPEYPAGLENGPDDLPKSNSASPTLACSENYAITTSAGDTKVEDVESTENENQQNSMSALKSYFPSVPDDALKDIYERCNGDFQWVVSLLMDAGYEMCFDEKDPSEELLQKSGSSLEGMAEISPDVNTGDRAEFPSATTEAAAKELTSTNDVSTADSQNQIMLRIDPIFAMQLQEMFGPIGFHLNPVSYYGSDLNINITAELAKSIHTQWSESLRFKFECEEAEIEKMMTHLAQDEAYAKRLQEEEDRLLAASLQPDPLGENFPPLEIRHMLLTHEKIPPKTEDLASRIKRRQLYEMFPKIDPKALDDVFNANNASFSETVQAIEVSFNPDQKPKLVVAPEQLIEYEQALVKFAEQESLLLEMGRTRKDELDDFSELTYEDIRAEATMHYRLRKECISKAKDAYDKNLTAAASFYSKQGRVHSEKLHEANKRASKMILEIRKVNGKADTLDLHMLHVAEALNALAKFLETKKLEFQTGQKTLRIITGKGNHSAMGLPRIKPAVLDYLTKQNYSHCDINGGLIEVYIRK